MMASAPRFGNGRQCTRGLGQFVIEDQRVEGDVAAHAAPMQRAHGFRQLFQRKAHLGARREMFEPEIDGVRAGFDGRAQLRPIARGTHDFRFTYSGHTWRGYLLG